MEYSKTLQEIDLVKHISCLFKKNSERMSNMMDLGNVSVAPS